MEQASHEVVEVSLNRVGEVLDGRDRHEGNNGGVRAGFVGRERDRRIGGLMGKAHVVFHYNAGFIAASESIPVFDGPVNPGIRWSINSKGGFG